MDLRIRHVVLWPKKANVNIRTITFELDGINVITGQSQTGKSALIPVIDYCLASDKCAIPVGVIRDTTEWFGVVFQLGREELLLARRNPGQASQSSEMVLLRSPRVAVPHSIERANTSVEAIKDFLNQIAGLSDLGYSTSETESGFDGPPSFRDLAAFEFQPQHIIANPHTLFFKADTYEHKKRLERILPLVLGVIDNDTLNLKRQLADLKVRLQQKATQLEERKLGARVWLGQLQGHFLKARELGLIASTVEPTPTWENEDYLRYLRPIPTQVNDIGIPRVERGATSRMVREMAALRMQEEETGRELEKWKRKLVRIEKFSESASSYDNALGIQQSRLEGIGWFSARTAHMPNECPMCGTRTDKAKEEIVHLLKLSEEVQTASTAMTQARALMDREAADARRRISELEDDTQSIRDQFAVVEERSAELKAQSQTLKEVHQFIGGLKIALQNLEAASDDGGLGQEVSELKQEEAELRRALNSRNETARMNAALDRLGSRISFYASQIGVERPDDVIRLDIVNLTVYRVAPSGRRDYLWEIGSGANWLGYHISTLLSLHEAFLEQKRSPVPRFLVLDQPSQVYFPDKWPGDPDPRDKRRPRNTTDPRSDDIARVHLIFAALASAIERTKGRLQIIVIDHADERTWSGISVVKRIQRWRGEGQETALIPENWYS